MKKSYIKIIVFELIIILISFINSFVSSILSKFYMTFFLIVINMIFIFILGIEKDRHRRTKDIIYELIINFTIFYLLYYLSGLFLSFYRTPNYYSFYGLTEFILPVIINIISVEFLRYNVLCKASGSKFLVVLTTITFLILTLTPNLHPHDLKSSFDIFNFLATYLLPYFSINILCTYLSFKGGYKPTILTRLFISLPFYIVPIFPNPNAYLKALIDFIIPFLVLYNIHNFIEKYEEKYVERDYNKGKFSLMLIPITMTSVIIYLVSGYFKYYAVAVASGSMMKTIDRGDVVILEQINSNYERIEVGDILVFKHNNTIIVHRIIKKISDGKKMYFYTKGDANKEEDKFKIEENDVIGVAKTRIPKIGYPTVWLNEL